MWKRIPQIYWKMQKKKMRLFRNSIKKQKEQLEQKALKIIVLRAAYAERKETT